MVTDHKPLPFVARRRPTCPGLLIAKFSIASLVLALSVGACSGASDPLEPEAYFASVSDAVTQYAAELDAVDQDLLAGEWTLPPSENRKEVDEFYYMAEIQARAGHLDAWNEFITALDSLAPPEGIAQLGEGFEDGFPEYIEEGVIAAERAAYEANAEHQRHREDFLEWFRGWEPDVDGNDEYRERRMKGDDLLSLAENAEDALEGAWNDLEGVADEAGFEFDATDLRTSGFPPSDLRVSHRWVDSVRGLVGELQGSQPSR